MSLWQALAGLGLFLFGMKQLESGLKLLAGAHFNRWIVNSTNQPILSVSTGIFTTAMVQSSSLVGLITLAFVGAGIMPLVNGIGVVLGSNLGTTLTGWMVATLGFKVDLSVMVYPLVALGGLGYGLLKGKLQSIALVVFGLALLLMGLGLMKDSFTDFSASLQLDLLQGYPLLVYLLFGVVITAIIQSSSVMMMLALAALYSDMLSLHAAAALVIGADLGTTSTVMIGSLQGSVAKRRLALAHVIFNVLVDIVAFLSIDAILALIQWIQIDDPLFGLVAFHSLFNLAGLLVFVPIINPYSRWLEKVVKTRKHDSGIGYINAVPPAVTEAALQALLLETKRLMSLVLVHNMRILDFNNQVIKDQELPLAFKQKDELAFYTNLKGLEGEIIKYALSVQQLSSVETTKNSQLEDVGLQVDHYMQAIRSAIFAAKSIKDIRQNLVDFKVHNHHEVQTFFSQLLAYAQQSYTELAEMMGLDCKLLSEELLPIKSKANSNRKGLRHQIHQHMSGHNVEATELSTLLNVNKEVYNSVSALVKALIIVSE